MKLSKKLLDQANQLMRIVDMLEMAEDMSTSIEEDLDGMSEVISFKDKKDVVKEQSHAILSDIPGVNETAEDLGKQFNDLHRKHNGSNSNRGLNYVLKEK